MLIALFIVFVAINGFSSIGQSSIFSSSGAPLKLVFEEEYNGHSESDEREWATVKQPTVKKETVKKPVVKQPVVNQPDIKPLVVKKPAVKPTPLKKSSYDSDIECIECILIDD